MKTLLRVAAVVAAVFTLGGCAVGWEDEPLPNETDFTAAAPAPAAQIQLAAVARAPAAPAATVAPAPRRVTYIVRSAPVLSGLAGGTCPWARAAQARAAEYRPAAVALAALPPRALEHRRVYRLTNY